MANSVIQNKLISSTKAGKPASAAKKPGARNSELAQIHIAKKRLRLEDDTYRDMLFTIARVRSSADLDHAGRAKVLDHLKKCGFKPKFNPFKTGAPKTSPARKTALISKIGALLTVLNKPWEYADGMAKKMFNVEKIIWLTPQKLHKLVAALEIAKAREAKKNAAAA